MRNTQPNLPHETVNAVLQNAPVLFWRADKNKVIRPVNQLWQEFTGIAYETLIDAGYRNSIHPDDTARFDDVFATAFLERKTFSCEFRLRRSDGAYHWMLDHGSPYFDASGDFLGFVGTTIDIHDRKEKEEKLIEQEQFLTTVLDNLPVALFSKDAKNNFSYGLWNKKAEQLFGLKRETAFGRNDYDFWEKAHADFFRKKDIEVIANEKTVTIAEEPISVAGKTILLATTKVPVRDSSGEYRHLLGISEDITDRVTRERMLAEEKTKLELISINIGDVIWMSDPQKQKITFVSWAYEKIWGRTCESLYENAISFLDAIHEEDRERIREALQNQTKGTYAETYRVVTPNGTIHWVEDRAFPVFNSAGECTFVIGIATNITDKVNQESEREQERLMFESIVNNIPVILTFFDENGRLQWVSPAYEKVLGWRPDEVKGKDLLRLTTPEAEIPKVLEFMASGDPGWLELETFAKDGSLRPTAWANVRLPNGRNIGIGQDLSLRRHQESIIKEQQAKIISSAKLSSLGEMASGIAHEINNPLAIISGKTRQIREIFRKGEVSAEKFETHLAKIEETTDRIAKIIKGLRAFSRGEDGDVFQTASLSQIIGDTLDLCSARFKSLGILLEVSQQSDLTLECRSVQISQVLLNLLNNALDAVRTLNDPWVKVTAQREGDLLSVRVTDCGQGIPSDISMKMMEPFFTTKEVGAGTGLGLSISKGIVEAHGGTFAYEPHNGNTSFVARLPLRKLS